MVGIGWIYNNYLIQAKSNYKYQSDAGAYSIGKFMKIMKGKNVPKVIINSWLNMSPALLKRRKGYF